MVITGYNSMIGSRFLELTQHNPTGFDLNPTSSTLLIKASKLDLVKASQDQILETFSPHQGEVLMHFAAFTDVDGAENQRGNTSGSGWQLNVEATKKLATVAKKLNLKVVYISTDFVFDGKSGPYSEIDKTAKSEDDISWYGWTKLEGEKIILSELDNFLIARISYPFRANFDRKTDFVRNIIKRLRNGNLYPMFYDQFLTPTFIDNFSKALDLLVREDQTGIWHVVDNTILSAYDASCEIAKVFGEDPAKIERASMVEFRKNNPKVTRPANDGLKNDKLRQFLGRFGNDMQDFRQALEEMKQQVEVKTS